jgi:RND superfamily putative drug exporter
MSNHLAERPTTTDRVATWIRRLCVPIVLFWVAVAALTNVLVPQLEAVGEEHNVALSSPDSPSLQAFQRIGKVFHEFDSDSAAMVVLEGDQPLGADAHRYYDELVKRFNADTKHVQHVQDFWGDPLTAAGSQSSDGKAAYVQVFLAGNQGEALSLESVAALRDIIAKTPAPPGVHAYVAGSAAQIADQFAVGNESTVTVTLLTVGVIAVMLLIVYRSPVTMILALVTVLIEMSAARGIVSFLANAGVIGLSTYSTNILTLLVIAAGTDYVIFLLGRYHEGRNDGDDREAAFYDMYRGTSHVILGSGLTIAGAVACLYFTRLPYFQSLGIPAAIGVLVSLVASLTLAPAVLVIGSRFGLLEPKRKTAKRGWRRIGTAIVRWPGPILIATLALALVGLASLSGYKVSYDISPYMPPQSVTSPRRG